MSRRFDGARPDLVVVTGDLTQQARVEEFAQAGCFFNALQEKLGLDRSRFLFLPGNHDVSWRCCEDYFGAYPEKRASDFDSQLAVSKLRYFNEFEQSFYGGRRPELINLERGARLYVDPKHPLCVATLCSCEQETDKKHLGVISEKQASINTLGNEVRFPYLVEFLLPPNRAEVSTNGVTLIDEDFLLELIEIILKQTREDE